MHRNEKEINHLTQYYSVGIYPDTIRVNPSSPEIFILPYKAGLSYTACW